MEDMGIKSASVDEVGYKPSDSKKEVKVNLDSKPDSFEKSVSPEELVGAGSVAVVSGGAAYKGVKNKIGTFIGNLENEFKEFKTGCGAGAEEVAKGLSNRAKTYIKFGAAGIAALGVAAFAISKCLKDRDGDGKSDFMDSVNKFFKPNKEDK